MNSTRTLSSQRSIWYRHIARAEFELHRELVYMACHCFGVSGEAVQVAERPREEQFYSEESPAVARLASASVAQGHPAPFGRELE